MVIQRTAEMLRPGTQDYDKKSLSVDVAEPVNNSNLNKLKEKSNLTLAFSRNEILLHADIPVKNPGSIRNMFINKYIQTQGSSVFLEDKPVVEIKI
jgi:fructose-1,6-bisphosphatase